MMHGQIVTWMDSKAMFGSERYHMCVHPPTCSADPKEVDEASIKGCPDGMY